MKAKTGKTKAAESDIRPMEGTREMGYWEFKKQFADPAGWKLQRTAPQTYQVLDGSRRKIGDFKSGKGYFPHREGAVGPGPRSK